MKIRFELAVRKSMTYAKAVTNQVQSSLAYCLDKWLVARRVDVCYNSVERAGVGRSPLIPVAFDGQPAFACVIVGRKISGTKNKF